MVDDQRGRPTFTRDAAPALLELSERRAEGVLHLCNGGETTWFGLARAIAEGMDLPAERVQPCGSDEYPRPAPRPRDSRLSTARLEILVGALPTWEDALRRYLEEEGWLAS